MKTFIKDRLEDVVRPPRLCPGDRIGIAAPASPFGAELFEKGIGTLRRMGFEPVLPDGLFEKDGYLAGSDRHRAAQLLGLFRDESIRAIVCARGGYGALRILPELDFDTIRLNPKILVGFSDISSLLSAIFQCCGLVTFHGPVVTTLADADDGVCQGFLAALSRPEPLTLRAARPVVLYRGAGTGPVAGGNLTTLCHLVGTPWAPVWKGHLVFLEDLNEAVYRIDRMLTQLKLAGCFDGVTGILLGRFKDCGETDAVYRLVMDLFDGEDLPILGGFDVGHGGANVTLPVGLPATLDVDRGSLTYLCAATVGADDPA